MIPIDLHPNLASILTLVSFHCLTLYLNNQTAHNWLFVALIKHGGGPWMEGASFLFAVIKHIPSLRWLQEEKKMSFLFQLSFLITCQQITHRVTGDAFMS